MDFLEGQLEASCCLIFRFLRALEALGPLEGPLHNTEGALHTEGAAAFAFVAAATDYLRCCRLALRDQEAPQNSEEGPPSLSLRAQGQWLTTLGALLQRTEEQIHGQRRGSLALKVSDEAAAAALSVASSWAPPEGREELLGVRGPCGDILGALQGFLMCSEPVLQGGPSDPAATVAEEAAKGLNYLLQQLLPSSVGSPSKRFAATQVSRQLLQLKQRGASEALEGAGLFIRGPRRALAGAIRDVNMKVLEQLVSGSRAPKP